MPLTSSKDDFGVPYHYILKTYSPVSNLSGFRSTPIILVAPQSLAPSATYKTNIMSFSLQPLKYECKEEDKIIHTANPIDPSPNITTVDPVSTFAVLQAAPTPKNPNIIEVNVM